MDAAVSKAHKVFFSAPLPTQKPATTAVAQPRTSPNAGFQTKPNHQKLSNKWNECPLHITQEKQKGIRREQIRSGTIESNTFPCFALLCYIMLCSVVLCEYVVLWTDKRKPKNSFDTWVPTGTASVNWIQKNSSFSWEKEKKHRTNTRPQNDLHDLTIRAQVKHRCYS